MNISEGVYGVYTWNQGCNFCSSPIINLIVKVNHAIFFSSPKIKDIVAFEVGYSLAQVGNKCFARHVEGGLVGMAQLYWPKR